MAVSTVVGSVKITREKGCHYYCDGQGNVLKLNRATKVKSTAHAHAFTPEKGFFYFINDQGHVAKTARVARKKKEAVPAPPSTPAPQPVGA